MRVGIADDVALDLHVHHDEVGPIEAVCHNATHEGGRQDHRVGSLLVEEPLHGIRVGKIKLLMGTTDQIGVTSPHQVIPDGGAYKPSMACDVYSRIAV